VAVRGRIGALIAVGAGFHPHMTGRENIRLNGTILGMSRREIDAQFDRIVDFADIGDFLDTPVATYSSGMTVRLGFAIAVHAQPEILLADEVLAVGDLKFALKCYRKIGEYRRNGGSLILVSHSMQLVRNTCQQAVWIDRGRAVAQDEAQDVCDRYELFMMQRDDRQRGEGAGGDTVINNDPSTRIHKVSFLDGAGAERSEHRWGDPLVVRLHFDCRRPVRRPLFTVSFFNPENIQVVSNYSSFDGFVPDDIAGLGFVDFTIDRLTLRPAEYRCMITFAEDGDVNNVLEWHDKSYSFVVLSAGSVSYGIYDPLPRWRLGS
jgi:hypothetical protein